MIALNIPELLKHLYVPLTLIALAAILRRPTVKGYLGELSVRILLGLLNKNDYVVLHDVMIPGAKMETSQIDHIVISRQGVFVIETKNYSGWIFGSESSKYWTQVQYRKKYQFYNPILQNQGHVAALRALLDEYPDVPFHPVVVFTLKAEFKKLDITSPVIRNSALLKFIRQPRDQVLTQEQIHSIRQAIREANQPGRLDRKEHAKRIQNLASANICPRCSGNLIERTGKNGRFLGCSNFPACRYTRTTEK